MEATNKPKHALVATSVVGCNPRSVHLPPGNISPIKGKAIDVRINHSVCSVVKEMRGRGEN